MKKIILFVLLSLSVNLLAAQQNTPVFGIIPEPVSVGYSEGTCVIDKDSKVFVEFDSESAEKTAELCAERIESLLGCKVALHKSSNRSSGLRIRFSSAYSGPREGYVMNVNSRDITVNGDDDGMYYGLQSLLQALVFNLESDRSVIPCGRIEDYPRFRYRGIMQDVGYHIYPVEFIKREIDMLAKYKMNVFHWHLTEDHGWRIEIKKYPKLNTVASFRDQTCISNYDPELTGLDSTPYGGYYTQEQIRDIVRYAEERHVTVIPEIELPGHTLAVLAAYPELACNPGPFKVAEYWGIYDDVFCAGKEEVFSFLEDILSEVMELFPSKYIHIGGDECPKDRWSKCPLCQKRIKDNGLKDEHELQSYFIRRIEKFVNSKGRQIIGWDEILEGGVAQNATVMSWRSVEEGIKAAKLRHDVVMAPVDYLYFDYLQGPREQEPLAIGWGFNPLERVYEFEPVPQELSPEEAGHIIGVEAPIWTEHIDTYRKAEYMLYPRLYALSEVAWSPSSKKNLDDLKCNRMPRHLEVLDKTDIIYRVPEPIGMSNETLHGGEFVIRLISPVKNGKIYYNFDGQEPRETDYLYENPVKIVVPPGEKREMRSIVVAPSGKRSVSVTTVFSNNSNENE